MGDGLPEPDTLSLVRLELPRQFGVKLLQGELGLMCRDLCAGHRGPTQGRRRAAARARSHRREVVARQDRSADAGE